MLKKLLFTLLFLAIATLGHGQISVPFDQKDLSYMGRVAMVEHHYAKIFWPGTSVTLRFKGTGVKATFKNGAEPTCFYAIVDGDDQHAIKITPAANESTVTLAAGLKNATHTVEIFKLSNNSSYTEFYGFELANGSEVLAARPLPKRKIEFYGDSITAGHGVDVLPSQPDSGNPEFYNNYLTYAARTARHFDAQYSCIAKGGIGVMVSWFPITMPEMYDRTDPEDPNSKWDFSKYTPDAVVINLLQNDSWLVEKPDHPQFKARFGGTPPDESKIIQSYQSFIKSLRGKYPQASIICVLGSMDATRAGSKWPGYVKQAVKGLNDSKIYTDFFRYKNSPGHPKAAEQKVMADELIDFIDKNIKW